MLQEIGGDFQKFGTLLLEDDNGDLVDSILFRNRGNGHESINRDIVAKWLDGTSKPDTWESLIEVLNDMKRRNLVKKIRHAIDSF